MRFTNVQYTETERVTVSYQNDNASLAIYDGMPVFMQTYDQVHTEATATPATASDQNLGVYVRTGSTALGSSLGPLLLGIAKVNNTGVGQPGGQALVVASTPAGGVGEAVCYGFTDAIVLVGTRAASNSTWASQATFGAGDQLIPETVNNYLTWSATVALGGNNGGIFAGQSFAGTSTTVASASTLPMGINTFSTVRMKVFVRLM